jgi:hypothetical protein
MVADSARVHRQVWFRFSLPLHLSIVHCWMHTVFSTAAGTTTGGTVLFAAFLFALPSLTQFLVVRENFEV